MSDPALGPDIPLGPASGVYAPDAEETGTLSVERWPVGALWIGCAAALSPVVIEFLSRQPRPGDEAWLISPTTYLFGLYALAAGALAQYERSHKNKAWKVAMSFIMAFDAVYALSLSHRMEPLGSVEVAILTLLTAASGIGFIISHAPMEITIRSDVQKARRLA